MENLHLIRPDRGVTLPTDPELIANRFEFASRIRELVSDCRNVVSTNLKSVTEIARETLANDDTAWLSGPVQIRDCGPVLELEMDSEFRRVVDGLATPAEPIVMPLHATSIFFCAKHDRSDDRYCTAIITCEDEKLLAGEPERPFFIWIG